MLDKNNILYIHYKKTFNMILSNSTGVLSILKSFSTLLIIVENCLFLT